MVLTLLRRASFPSTIKQVCQPVFYERRHLRKFLFHKKGYVTESEHKNLFARFRVLLTRRRRAWTRDDLWALVSWLFVGQGLFILAGTTTFASIVLLLANSLQFQDWLARQLTQYLAKHTGLEVSFGETIVPNWRTGRISFRDISVHSIRKDGNNQGIAEYALYDLRVEKAEVALSMKRFLEGQGLVESCQISGVRGTVDRSGVRPDVYNGWKYEAQPGDFDLQRVSLRDILVTIINPDDFRRYNLSVISAELPRLRKRYILYDFLGAESVVGMLDGSLFSMHIPQVVLGGTDRKRCTSMRHLKLHALNVDFFSNGVTTGPLSWLTRGSVDIDVFVQLPLNYRNPSETESLTDKIGALTEGILVQILRESSIANFSSKEATIQGYDLEQDSNDCEFKVDWTGAGIEANQAIDWMSREVVHFRQSFWEMRNFLFGPFLQRLRSRMKEDILNVDDQALEPPEQAALHFLHRKPDSVTFKVDFRFHNLRAHLPWGTNQGLVGTALIRPLVAYINEQRPFIPISCHFNVPLIDFDGAWTIYESGIVAALSRGAADSLERLVSDRQNKIRRLKRVSLWSFYALFRNIRSWMSHADYYHFYYPMGSG